MNDHSVVLEGAAQHLDDVRDPDTGAPHLLYQPEVVAGVVLEALGGTQR
jgi:hypothetical protein